MSVCVKSKSALSNQKLVGRLTFVDLASPVLGQEKQSLRSFSERAAFNNTLFGLNQLDLMVSSLVARPDKKPHSISNFNNSKLTQCLKEAIGGNSITSCLIFCSHKTKDIQESIKTLKFANSIQKVVNYPQVNFQTETETEEEEFSKYS